MSRIDRQRAFDWRPALLHGVSLAADNHRDYNDLRPWAAMWELLREAVRVSRAYEAPPRSGYPETSWPDAPDEITPWQRQMAYLRGDLDEMPVDEPAPVTPTTVEITRAEAVLDLWHRCALWRGGYPHPCKRHIYRLAEGAPIGAIIRASGMRRDEVLAWQKRAAEQMLRGAGVSN